MAGDEKTTREVHERTVETLEQALKLVYSAVEGVGRAENMVEDLRPYTRAHQRAAEHLTATRHRLLDMWDDLNERLHAERDGDKR
ncbi:hypothetical protein [Myceligenerans pegani]|uniref:Uncharacterized protein n=1 Tax=Myceligenerans pegani TaxID=2776917 RepID=A0ABR9N2H1_9MICO|nr:hypothetical protein [Myceligenerans sp. TRM 65318]MBE1877845.1 hypothetical protein [Myceligenerans sp. TRM 65318]MBE3020116.1 hypothetical protein [Myceligenerans sp. TRM 65318]